MDATVSSKTRLWFSDLWRVSVRPRRTMAEILVRPWNWPALMPLVLLTLLGSWLKDTNPAGLQKIANGASPAIAAVIVAVLVCVALLSVVAFYGLSWVAWGVGRFLEGTGQRPAVRQAVAWSLAPRVWTLLYRIPVSIAFPPPESAPGFRAGRDGFTFIPGAFAHGCGLAAILGLVELALFAWWIVVASRTIAEAHGFSAWKGLATVLVSIVSPFVIVAAAVLAAVM
jgi:hypothetical protein